MQRLLDIGIEPERARYLASRPDFRAEIQQGGKGVWQEGGHQRPRPTRSTFIDSLTFPNDPQWNNPRPERSPTAYYSRALQRTE